MDLILNVADEYVLTPYVYPATWHEDYIPRQALSLYVFFVLGGYLLYLGTAALSYYTLFDHRLMTHPQFLKNQVWLEIRYACSSIPVMAALTVPIMVLEVRGHCWLYLGIEGAGGWLFILFSAVAFLMFTDCTIYWIHRWLHHRLVFKHLHKGHHKWKIPTPFASHAFHPIDGWLQALPYHLYTFLFPLHKVLYLCLFLFVNIWTVSIHDGNYRVPRFLRPFINGSAHHTDHHLYFYYNYGQFFTLWDRIGGSFMSPTAFDGDTLLKTCLSNGSTTSTIATSDKEK